MSISVNASRISRATQPTLGQIIESGNVHVEFSMLEGVAGIAKLLKSVPVERVHFGSHLPLFVVESAVLKLQESPLSEQQLAAITHGNSSKLLQH